MAKMLEGQIAVVTGGSRGIGAAICKKLAELGAQVVVNFSSSPGGAEAVVTEIQAAGGQAEALQFSVSDSAAVDAAFKQILERYGRIDILVNNAGIALDNLLMRTKDEEWQRTLDVNLSGCFFCSRAVSRPMMKQRGGRIVNISSVIGEMGNAGQAAYAASKAGVIGLTKSMARELASRNVLVNAVTPGYIQTDMTGVLDDSVKSKILESIPLGSIGTAEDVAEAVAYLCLPASRYMTGQVLGVNGGMNM